MKKPIAIFWYTTSAFLTGCGGDASEVTPTPVALVELQAAQTRSLSETVAAYGTTEFAAADVTTIAAQVESQVTELFVTSGSNVKKGQALLRLAPSAVTRLEVDKSRRDAAVANAEHERVQRLRAVGLATESDLQLAASAAATLAQLRDSLAARVGPGNRLTVRAPRAGIVDTLTVQPGDVLAPGSVAVRIAVVDFLQVRLGIEPHDANKIAPGQQVRVTPLAAGVTTVMATIGGIDRRVDSATQLIAALVRLPKGSGFLPGAVVHADIVVSQHSGAIVIPRAALLYAGDHPFLFVASNGVAHRRDVTVGVQDGESIEVTSGLRAGESIVVVGNTVLGDGMAIRTADDNRTVPGDRSQPKNANK